MTLWLTHNNLRRYILYISLFLMPFLLMVIVNESARPALKSKPYKLSGAKAINSSQPLLDKCTWYCYKETTSHCKKNHTTFSRPYFKYIDPIYMGMKKLLYSGGNYQLMNVVFLVFIIPLLIFFST